MTLPQLPPPHHVTTPDQLAQMIAALRQAQRFALDTESNSLFAYYYRVCLIQISTDHTDYLLDPLALEDLAPLRALVAEPGIEVTMHAAENDLLLLHHDFGFLFSQVFDTLWAARILGWNKPGLASILKEHFGVVQNKRMQRADWGKRPLTAEQLQYARLDTHYLLPLRDQLERDLRRAGRWEEAKEVFASLLDIRWEEKEPPTIWRISGVRDLTPQQLAVLQALFDWREKRAQQRDIPPFKVLRNETLVSLAQNQPATANALRRTPFIPRRLPNHLVRQLLQAIRRGQAMPPPSPPQRTTNNNRRPTDAELARYERLRAWRTRVARARGVDPDVVLTNQVLMALARAHPADMDALQATGLLGPWKLDAYGRNILQAM
jgi:ribonuclease D